MHITESSLKQHFDIPRLPRSTTLRLLPTKQEDSDKYFLTKIITVVRRTEFTILREQISQKEGKDAMYNRVRASIHIRNLRRRVLQIML